MSSEKRTRTWGISGIVGFLVVIVGVGLFLPRQWSAKRRVVIHASPRQVAEQISKLEHWQRWTVWNRRNFGDLIVDGDNTSQTWKHKAFGSVLVKLDQETPSKRWAYVMEFLDQSSEIRGAIELHDSSEGTEVEWTVEGEVSSNPFARWAGLLLIRSIVAADCEVSLDRLKEHVELEG